MTVRTHSIDRFCEAAGLTKPQHLALVGGGGKTSIMHAVGSQLAGRTVLTCTTKMGADQNFGRAVLVDPTDEALTEAAGRDPVMVWARVGGEKAFGVAPEACDRWFGLVDNVIIEADGARRKPFKAPKPFEPVVPVTTTTMVSVIGADALGRVIADNCHRPMRVAAMAECSPYVRLTPAAAAKVLLHPDGAIRALPCRARLVIAVTKVPLVENSPDVVDMVEELCHELAIAQPDLTVVPVAFDHHVADGSALRHESRSAVSGGTGADPTHGLADKED